MYPFKIRGITENKNVEKVTAMRLSNDNKKEFVLDEEATKELALIYEATKEFALNEEATEETLQQLVREIPAQTAVMFYDKDYPSPSDPGAYVSFMRVNNEYLIQRGNHGWINKWVPMGAEKLENYLLKCSQSHKMGAAKLEYMNVYYERKEPGSKSTDRSGGKLAKLERQAKTLITIALIALLILLTLLFVIVGIVVITF